MTNIEPIGEIRRTPVQMRDPCWRGLIRCVVGCLASFCFGSVGIAQTYQDTFVTKGTSRTDALKVSVSLELPPSTVLGTVHVTITNPKRKNPADRNLTVVFYRNSRQESGGGVAYRVSVKFAEGTSQVAVDIPYVHVGTQNAWDVAVFEEGRDIEDVRQRPPNQATFQWTYSDGNLPAIAAIFGTNDSLAKVEQNLNALGDSQSSSSAVNAGGRGTAGRALQHIIPVNEAAADWRRYVTYSAWLLTGAALAEINEVNTGAAQALREYVAAGGVLIVQEANQPSVLRQLDRLFLMEELTRNDNPDQAEARQREFWFERAQTIETGEIWQREYLGGILFLTSKPLSDLPATVLAKMLTKADAANLSSIASEKMDGNWFWRNLIAAVGKPPVWVFCGIVTLFGTLLGPGLLFLTARIGRRSLMILLVPAVALVATSAIIAYGILHEGFDTHVRVTSVSRIDYASKAGFIWSRQNYFSGLPPRAGIDFSANTFVRPVQEDESHYYGISEPRRGVSVSVTLGEKQNWRGWLKPRQQQQLLVGHAVSVAATPLQVTRAETGEIDVMNQSGQDLPFVILRGEGDDYYFGSDLHDSQTLNLSPQTSEDVGAEVAKAMVDFRPEMPPEMQSGGSLMSLGSNSNRRLGRSYDADDVINRGIRTYLSDRLEMPPFSFATLLPVNDLVEVPVEGQRSGDLHIVIGTQSW